MLRIQPELLRRHSFSDYRGFERLALVSMVSGLLACGNDVSNLHLHADASAPNAGMDAGANVEPVDGGVPGANTLPGALNLDVFGSIGARYWFVVSEAEVERMNERLFDELLARPSVFQAYWPGGPEIEPTFADHLVITTPGSDPHVADFGKVQVRLGAQSLNQPWTPQSLPHLIVDATEFSADQRIGGQQQLRFHNAVTGDIFREKLAFELYRKLGYPAPRTGYAWVSSSVWAPGIAVPYLVVEAYAEPFCDGNSQLGGGCSNLWEFGGDLGQGFAAFPGFCQLSSCDPARALALDAALGVPAADYKLAFAAWIDWDAFHRFQCLGWILSTGTDALRSGRQVLAERADGKFQYLPFSVDVSLGHEGAPTVTLPAQGILASGCQSDPQCWADTISTCEALIGEFAAADPIGMLNRIHAELEAEGMLRGGDESRYQGLAQFLERRLIDLPLELELNRPAPYFGCQDELVPCGRECRFPGFCVLCEATPEPLPSSEGDAGTPDAGVPPEVIDCVPPIDLPSSLSTP